MSQNKIIHLAIATSEIEKCVHDYTQRLGKKPCVVVPNQYALWRTKQINLSIRQDISCKSGELRHLGFEDPNVKAFTTSKDVNDILWESFTPEHQAQEINNIWPETNYQPDSI